MKRLLLVVLMILVTLVWMVGFSGAAEDPATRSVTLVIGNIQLSLDAISNDQINVVSALQATANTTNETVGTLQATVNEGAPTRAKMYYLTKNSFEGCNAITACDSGFHMASISEIQDPSNLQYANRSTAEYLLLVDGQRLGPPSNRMGWVRSGVYPPSGFVYDCEDFLERRGNHSGTTLSLNDWFEARIEQTASTPNMWWQAAHSPCSQPEPVWCVEDPD